MSELHNMATGGIDAGSMPHNVPFLAFVFAAVGFTFITFKVISLLRLLFSLFIFPGIPVSTAGKADQCRLCNPCETYIVCIYRLIRL